MLFNNYSDVESVIGIPLTISEQMYGGNVHIRCRYNLKGTRYTNVQWSWSKTGDKASAQNIYYYDSHGNEDKEGRLTSRNCSKTHTTDTIGLIINNTIDIDDGTYFGELRKGAEAEYCKVNYTSWSK